MPTTIVNVHNTELKIERLQREIERHEMQKISLQAKIEWRNNEQDKIREEIKALEEKIEETRQFQAGGPA